MSKEKKKRKLIYNNLLVLTFTLLSIFITINGNTQSIVKSVPFLKKNGFYTLVKYGTKIPVIQKDFENLMVLNESLIACEQDGKMSLIDMDGEILIEGKNINSIRLIDNNIISLCNGASCVYYDTSLNKLDDEKIKNLFTIKKIEKYELPYEYYKYFYDTSKLTVKHSSSGDKITLNSNTDEFEYEIKGKMSILFIDSKTKNIFFKCIISKPLNKLKKDGNGDNILDEYGNDMNDEEILAESIILLSDNGKFKAKYNSVDSIGHNLYSVSKNYIKSHDLDVENTTWFFGIINGNGDKITPEKFNDIGNFNSGLSLVRIKKDPESPSDDYYTGFINTKGELVKPLELDNRIYGYSEGLAFDFKGKSIISFMDTLGKNAFTLSKDYYLLDDPDNKGIYFQDGLMFVGNDKKITDLKTKLTTSISQTCLINTSGKIIKCGQWGNRSILNNYPSNFYEGISIIKNGEKYGLIDKKGNTILNPKYDLIYGYCGKIVEYTFESVYENGSVASRRKGLNYFSYIYDDKDKEYITKIIFNDLILVKQMSSQFYVDKNGFEYIER